MPHDDQSPPPGEVSDSADIEEEEDPEIEEEEDDDDEEDPEIVEEEEEEEEGEDNIEEEEEEEDEEEEEEEEVEKGEQEEIMEEERVEVDMDISDSPVQARDHHNDVRRDYKPEGLDGIHSNESHDDGKAYLRHSEVMDAKAANSSGVAGEEMADAILMRDHLGKEVKSVMNPEDEMKQGNIHLRNDRKQMDSRSAASEKVTRIMSPVAETSDRNNKRPAIICDFFAKGWCIRGTSCKFVHIKDNPNSTRPQGDVAAVNYTREIQPDEGLRDITERSRSPGFPDPLASSHLSSEKIRFSEHKGIQRQHQSLENHKFPAVPGEESNMDESTDAQKLYSSKDDQVFLSSFKDVGRDGHARNWPVDGYNNSPIHKDNSRFMSGLHPEPGFFCNGSTASSGKYSRGNPTSQSSCMEEPAGIWSQRMHSDHSSPLASLSLNSNSSNLLTNGSFPASRISSWTGFSLPSSYSCLDASPHGTQKLLDRNRDYRYSTRSSPLLKSSSPFSSSELKKLPSTSVSLRSDKLQTKISSNDWEPSVPFRPSFILPPAFLSSSGSQYDPLRDSVELPKLANISFEASFYSEEAVIGNKLHHQIRGESVSGTMRPACDGDTNSMSSHNTCHEKVLDNSCYTREHNSPVTEAETVGASVVCQNGTMTIEENLLGPSHLKGNTKPHKTSSYGDSRPQSDSSRHKKDITVDRFRENNEVDGEHVTDGDVQQESKALRHFRAALVELVKELLKPKWREGCLSKDAHNKIVKKAVEKVLSAFQPHQIPPTVETVVQYLSSCRPKISKLVEGYVEKYGKS